MFLIGNLESCKNDKDDVLNGDMVLELKCIAKLICDYGILCYTVSIFPLPAFHLKESSLLANIAKS